ncbi:MAG: hypothetical protein MRQ11_02280 [Candidatus Midichloria mitochondrii]|uniref:hypothetical protein n=1 Tax=Candidatus Midichloria mitochondrii TaxID=234827 RepID=UPI0002FC0AD7|nr:hypothetical protein [Candidatus Midichloria mitochondrii]MDJ1583513.1 hypothetical protein [Candidatus Midichloria mitochondrii]
MNSHRTIEIDLPNPAHPRHRSPNNFLANLFSGLLAYVFKPNISHGKIGSRAYSLRQTEVLIINPLLPFNGESSKGEAKEREERGFAKPPSYACPASALPRRSIICINDKINFYQSKSTSPAEVTLTPNPSLAAIPLITKPLEPFKLDILKRK